MRTTDEQLQVIDAPRLHVFWGEENSDDDNRRPLDKNYEGHGDWVHIEAYWAGRNYAGRRSARIAA